MPYRLTNVVDVTQDHAVRRVRTHHSLFGHQRRGRSTLRQIDRRFLSYVWHPQGWLFRC